jgi:protein-S-isoprenylcysteine O-methyltransferase Ste14
MMQIFYFGVLCMMIGTIFYVSAEYSVPFRVVSYLMFGIGAYICAITLVKGQIEEKKQNDNL